MICSNLLHQHPKRREHQVTEHHVDEPERSLGGQPDLEECPSLPIYRSKVHYYILHACDIAFSKLGFMHVLYYHPVYR